MGNDLNNYLHNFGITMPVKGLQVICCQHKDILLPENLQARNNVSPSALMQTWTD
jgi:hypothetical protein